MKKVLYFAMLVLGMSIMLCSCEKEGGNSNALIGEWTFSKMDVFADNNLLGTINTISAFSYSTEKDDIYYFPTPSLVFNENGTLSSMGISLGTYKYNNGTIEVSSYNLFENSSDSHSIVLKGNELIITEITKNILSVSFKGEITENVKELKVVESFYKVD